MGIKEVETEVFRIKLTPQEIGKYKRTAAAAADDVEDADPWGYVALLCANRGKQVPGCASEELQGDELVICELTYVVKGTNEQIQPV